MLARHAIVGSAVIAAAALITACSNATTASAPMAAPAHGSAGSAAYGASSGSGTPSSSTDITIGTAPTAELQRSVRAAYTIPPGSFLTSFDGVTARAVALGGYVASSVTQPAHNGRIVSGTVTLAVPAPSLASFLNGMPSTFTAVSVDFASVDHTAQFIDVSARLASAHAHLHALDALLSKATSLADITTLEQQIETVQVEIDTYQGQLDGLTASVNMATATIALSERGAPRLVETVPGPLNTGVSGGWHNAIQVTSTVLDVLITAIPLLVLAGLALALWHWVPRRLRRTPRAAP
jgi:Domain of unknown function (DUF4349)